MYTLCQEDHLECFVLDESETGRLFRQANSRATKTSPLWCCSTLKPTSKARSAQDELMHIWDLTLCKTLVKMCDLTSVLQWSTDHVKIWLQQCGHSDSVISLLCEEHNIDGKALLTLTESDLKSPPVNMKVHNMLQIIHMYYNCVEFKRTSIYVKHKWHTVNLMCI